MSLPPYNEFMRLLALQRDPCPICFEPFTSRFRTSCGHDYCIECARRWFRTKSSCPSCRTELYDKNTVPYEMRDDYDSMVDESDGYISDEDVGDQDSGDGETAGGMSEDESDCDVSDDDGDESDGDMSEAGSSVSELSEYYDCVEQQDVAACEDGEDDTSKENEPIDGDFSLANSSAEDNEIIYIDDGEPRHCPARQRYEPDGEDSYTSPREIADQGKKRLMFERLARGVIEATNSSPDMQEIRKAMDVLITEA